MLAGPSLPVSCCRSYYESTLIPQSSLERAVPSLPLIYAVYRRFGLAAIYAVPLASAFAVAAYSLGILHAEFREFYFVTEEARPKVILAQFGDKLVTASFDAKSHTVDQRFTIYEVGKAPQTMSLRDVGPLRPKENYK